MSLPEDQKFPGRPGELIFWSSLCAAWSRPADDRGAFGNRLEPAWPSSSDSSEISAVDCLVECL